MVQGEEQSPEAQIPLLGLTRRATLGEALGFSMAPFLCLSGKIEISLYSHQTVFVRRNRKLHLQKPAPSRTLG